MNGRSTDIVFLCGRYQRADSRRFLETEQWKMDHERQRLESNPNRPSAYVDLE